MSTTDPAFASPEQRAGDDFPVPVTPVDGLALVLWSLLGQLLITVLVVGALAAAGVEVTELAGASLGAVTVVTLSLTMAGSLAWLSGRGAISWRLLGPVRPQAWHVAAGLGGAVLAFATSTLTILAGDALVGPLEEPGQALLESDMLAGTAGVLTLLTAGVLAPLFEELTFRSVLFQSLGRQFGPWVAIGLSSVVFGLVHVEVLLPPSTSGGVYLVALTAVGAVFAWLFHRTGSLVVAIVAHAGFNAGQLVLAGLFA